MSFIEVINPHMKNRLVITIKGAVYFLPVFSTSREEDVLTSIFPFLDRIRVYDPESVLNDWPQI
jgi:hypothetical protein